MSFNGSGVYSPPSLPGSFNPAITGQQATAADWATLLADFAAAWSLGICNDGQTTITQNIPFNSKKITALGSATLTTDAINAGQVVSNGLTGQADTGAADAYVIAPTIPITAYAAYQRFQFVALHANTGAATVAVSSLAVKSIKRPNGDALSANDILLGAICDVQYDGTNFILLSGGNSDINDSLLTTRGDIIARGAAKPARVAVGTAGQYLGTDGTDPIWSTFAAAPTATASTTFLTGDVALNNTANFFNGPTTGSIGAAGQIWLIMATAALTDTSSGAAVMEARIHDGSAAIADQTALPNSALASFQLGITLFAVVTLAAATTFTLQAKDQTTTSGTLLKTGSAGTANKATSITAIRLS